MFFIDDGIFKECMEQVKRLKENSNNLEAHTAFIKAISCPFQGAD
jgi:hypothetical protein